MNHQKLISFIFYLSWVAATFVGSSILAEGIDSGEPVVITVLSPEKNPHRYFSGKHLIVQLKGKMYFLTEKSPQGLEIARLPEDKERFPELAKKWGAQMIGEMEPLEDDLAKTEIYFYSKIYEVPSGLASNFLQLLQPALETFERYPSRRVVTLSKFPLNIENIFKNYTSPENLLNPGDRAPTLVISPDKPGRTELSAPQREMFSFLGERKKRQTLPTLDSIRFDYEAPAFQKCQGRLKNLFDPDPKNPKD